MSIRTFLTALIILFFSAFIAWSDDNATDTGSPDQNSFGLQASIFNNVRTTNTDYLKNFSTMAEYSLTPGDIFRLSITSGIKSDGSISNVQKYDIQLGKDYFLNVPFIGKVDTREKSLPEIQNYIDLKIRKIIPVQYIEFVLVSPAQFNVFIYGGVNLPGFIVATPFLTVVDAIALSKGFKPYGSYRKVELIRKNDKGEPHTTFLDISRFYEKADLSANPVLSPGDKIYVPPASIVANITGEIAFPGTYELIEGETLKDFISYSGGTSPDAAASRMEITRIDEDGTRNVHTVSQKESSSFPMQNGDMVIVRSTSENSEMVTIEGAVFGNRVSGQSVIKVPEQQLRRDLPYYPGINLLSVLDAVGGPTPFAVYKDSYVRHKKTGEKTSVDIENLWKTRDQKLNITLEPGDSIFIPITTLKIFVTGSVTSPGAFPYIKGYTTWDYILLAGGPIENIADLNGIFQLNDEGERTKITRETELEPGSQIYIAKNILRRTEQFKQNTEVIIGTAGIIVTIWTFVQTVFSISDFIKARTTPAQ